MSRRLAVLVVLLAFNSACGNPPDKEIHQAQGAVDTARAAGAEQYAPAAFDAATTALGRSHDAVTQRDYRLALSLALEAQENARAAAHEAADQKAIVRSETEHTLAAVETAIARAEARLRAARGLRSAAAASSALQAQVADAKTAVQKARSALADTDYLAARGALRGILDGLTASLETLEGVLNPRHRR